MVYQIQFCLELDSVGYHFTDIFQCIFRCVKVSKKLKEILL
jgi:hypothetical protein